MSDPAVQGGFVTLLIHASITVAGEPSALDACDARINQLLAEQPLDGEFTAHRGEHALCYDFKVTGGLPFPVFAQASLEFPALTITAEWVNAGAGVQGIATMVAGKLTEHRVDPLATKAGDARRCYVAVSPEGRLKLALTPSRLNRDVWLGYALTAERDALFRAVRTGPDDGIELFATEGSPEWSLRWQGSLAGGTFEFELMAAPQAIATETYRELEQLAQAFVGEWIWFASGAREDTAIERERYARAGYAVSDANVRSARLHKMQSASAMPGGELVYSTLSEDEMWVKDVIVRCWVSKKA